MGVLWHVPNPYVERIWIYGTSFVFMLDLKQDLPESDAKAAPPAPEGTETKQQGKKRKRHGTASGAGNKVREMATGSHEIQMYDPARSKDWEQLDQDYRPDGNASELEDDMDDQSSNPGELALLRARRGVSRKQDMATSHRPAWWHTYKYRPILGIVPLAKPDDEQFEVAVVERPIWDVDLPDRFVEDNNGRDTGFWQGP
jgi:U3 small nucleolar RNA-associated protein 4